MERSKKLQLQKNCKSKRVYHTFIEASKESSSLNNKGVYVKPYECGVCKKFHLTKRSKARVLDDLFSAIEKERLSKK